MTRTRKTYTVAYKPGLNLREGPGKDTAVLRVLAYGEKVTADNDVIAPDGWLAVKGGGYVMKEFLE